MIEYICLNKRKMRFNNLKKQGSKKTAIIASVMALAVLIIVALIVIVPIANISRDFNAIIDEMDAFESPCIVITDMSAENNFSGNAGEVSIDDENSAKVLICDVVELAKNFKYESRDTSVGAWDIRFKVIDGDRSVDIYMANEKMYFIKNDVKYVFAPQNSEILASYKALYNGISSIVM